MDRRWSATTDICTKRLSNLSALTPGQEKNWDRRRISNRKKRLMTSRAKRQNLKHQWLGIYLWTYRMCVYLTFLLKISNVKIGVRDIPSPFADDIGYPNPLFVVNEIDCHTWWHLVDLKQQKHVQPLWGAQCKRQEVCEIRLCISCSSLRQVSSWRHQGQMQ